VSGAITSTVASTSGLTDWATFDNGEPIVNPRWTRNELPHLADLQRQRARKKKGSVRFKRLTRQAARRYERISNLRREFLHQSGGSSALLHCRP